MFKNKDTGFLVYYGLAVFVILGFLWEPMQNARMVRGNSLDSFPNASIPNPNPAALQKIDWAEITSDIGKYVTQGYGKTPFAAAFEGMRDNWHNGIDIEAASGAPLLSQSSGRVIYAGNQDDFCRGRGYGRFVVVQNSDNKYALLYAHLSGSRVDVGDEVKAGDLLGYVGTTGLTTGPHLHFSVFDSNLMKITDADSSCGPRPSGGEVNPLVYLKLK